MIGDTFGVHKSTVSRSVDAVTDILASKLNDYVKWPNARQKNVSKNLFYNVAGFPAVIGKIAYIIRMFFISLGAIVITDPTDRKPTVYTSHTT